ncbi:carbohydrate ABC transporter permease [Roseomonas haemaphysalidis]|jgi:sn-glycerol 3-phosphate transport system permease protein|uniref:sn-glycerol-3-phosphate transport system permease protein UgpA n=1 Tax=Roseomonas haemaphysalidis TaxID=2768162 RepID=A0ABS3KLW9_9PROT|nr:sugar ABC transporter permease [Roseomonas haemaphysalidis]MBO1078447.1 sugar ABC transporter permease [Roseomonas haemaphysalidis]
MSHSRRALFRSPWLPWALVAPQLLIIFVFFYWPTGEALYWAFTLEQPWGGGNDWVGLQNFAAVFTDPNYWHSVRISVVYAVATTILAIGISLLLAMFVDRELTYTRGYRLALIWPYAIAAPAVGIVFRFVFDPRSGVFAVLNQASPGLWNPVLNGNHAMVMLVLAGAWQLVSYNFVFLLAGLQSIPRGLVEAAAMDGAGPLRRMRDLQAPLLAPTLFFLVIINLTDSFTHSFALVDVMTAGGPARSTDLMVYKIYADGFKGLDYSGAAAQSIVLMLLVVALTFIQFRFVERRLHYK